MEALNKQLIIICAAAELYLRDAHAYRIFMCPASME
jgi:hypothetical protein